MLSVVSVATSLWNLDKCKSTHKGGAGSSKGDRFGAHLQSSQGLMATEIE